MLTDIYQTITEALLVATFQYRPQPRYPHHEADFERRQTIRWEGATNKPAR